MFRKFETLLTMLILVLCAFFLLLALIRMWSILKKKDTRYAIWNKEVGIIYKFSKTILAIILPLFAAGIVYFIFVVSIPSVVIRNYAKTLFCLIFPLWAFLEFVFCFSISKKLLGKSKMRRILFFFCVIGCISGAIYLFPLIPQSLPYPAASECVIIDLPVRGMWLAGHAGASDITNGHLSSRYAIDILKLGNEGRFYKENEKEVTDFFSYNEPVYAPAPGRVTQVKDGLPSDTIGKMDKDNPGGNIVILHIGNDRYIYFGHLKKGSISVKEGQSVKAGTVLGRIGNSGYTTHPHLHLHIQNKPKSNLDGRITYPFRFRNMQRKRFLFWRKVHSSYLLRGDRFCD